MSRVPASSRATLSESVALILGGSLLFTVVAAELAFMGWLLATNL
jgi:hypothetical protein